jgi:hypothetical protein
MACLTRVLAQTTPSISLMQAGAQSQTSAETTAFVAQQTARWQGVPLPTYAPDDTPIAKLWQKLNQQEPHLHSFPPFEALPKKVEPALRKCTNAPEDILARCSLPTAWAQAA